MTNPLILNIDNICLIRREEFDDIEGFDYDAFAFCITDNTGSGICRDLEQYPRTYTDFADFFTTITSLIAEVLIRDHCLKLDDINITQLSIERLKNAYEKWSL